MIKVSLLQIPFTVSHFPSLPCPSCEASLVIDEKDCLYQPSAQSAFYMDMEGGNALQYYQGVGTFLLKCTSPKCSERVLCSGLIRMKQDGEDWNTGREHYSVTIEPHYFLPAIRIISVPENLPPSIVESLDMSFKLFWINPSASGNALRTLVEKLMDHERVRKSYRDKKQKRRLYVLHDRIGLYKLINKDIADKLIAIKWIGNQGSHITGLTREGLLNAYRILEHVLEELFDRKSKSLSRLVSNINRKRGSK